MTLNKQRTQPMCVYPAIHSLDSMEQKKEKRVHLPWILRKRILYKRATKKIVYFVLCCCCCLCDSSLLFLFRLFLILLLAIWAIYRVNALYFVQIIKKVCFVVIFTLSTKSSICILRVCVYAILLWGEKNTAPKKRFLLSSETLQNKRKRMHRLAE